MNDERWQMVETLYHAALEREPRARATFLDRMCAGDEELRREVEALIVYDGKTASFIETPAVQLIAK